MERGRIRPPGKRRRLALYLNTETVRALRMEALRQDTSASAVVEGLVREWLQEQTKKNRRGGTGRTN